MRGGEERGEERSGEERRRGEEQRVEGRPTLQGHGSLGKIRVHINSAVTSHGYHSRLPACLPPHHDHATHSKRHPVSQHSSTPALDLPSQPAPPIESCPRTAALTWEVEQETLFLMYLT